MSACTEFGCHKQTPDHSDLISGLLHVQIEPQKRKKEIKKKEKKKHLKKINQVIHTDNQNRTTILHRSTLERFI